MKIFRNRIRQSVIISKGPIEICVSCSKGVVVYDLEIDKCIYYRKLKNFKEVLQIVNYYLFEY